MTAIQFAGYPASLAMGAALGLMGGGGSILTVPILVYLFGVLPLAATSYSLAIVGLVALWGAWGAYRTKELHLRTGIFFGVPGLVGVIVARRFVLPALPQSLNLFGLILGKDSLLLVLFALLMLAASFSMIRASRKLAVVSREPGLSPSPIGLLAVGLLVGVTVGFVGAGGGFLIVPALVSLAKLEMRQAVGTSLFVISLQSLLGLLGDPASLRAIDVSLFVSIALLAVLGMSLGAKLRHRMAPERLKFAFGIFVLSMGALILLRELN